VKLKKIIREDIQDLNSSNLPNPLYGKNIFFFDGCVEPKNDRNQLMGYLGIFCGYNKLDREIDYCILPKETSNKIVAEKTDQITELLYNKINHRKKDTGSITNTIPNTAILPEEVLFTYIKNNLIQKDEVKKKQFERLNLTFELNPYQNNIRYSEIHV